MRRMGSLVYTVLASLDGYVCDEQGSFEWAAPDAEVHAFVNSVERGVGTHLLGRRMYDVLKVWDQPAEFATEPQTREYAEIWAATDKVVYSTTLSEVTTKRTRLERELRPDAVRQLKEQTDRDLGIGGPGLAAHALRAGLVDEVGIFVAPVVVGGGTGWLPAGLRVDLDLLEERRFRGGTAYLRYRVR